MQSHEGPSDQPPDQGTSDQGTETAGQQQTQAQGAPSDQAPAIQGQTASGTLAPNLAPAPAPAPGLGEIDMVPAQPAPGTQSAPRAAVDKTSPEFQEAVREALLGMFSGTGLPAMLALMGTSPAVTHSAGLPPALALRGASPATPAHNSLRDATQPRIPAKPSPHGLHPAPLPMAAKTAFRPGDVTTRMVNEFKADPSCVDMVFNGWLEYLGVHPIVLGYPWDLKHVVTDFQLRKWIETYVVAKGTSFVHAEFLQDLRRFVCNEVRPAESVALDELLSGRVRQGEDPVVMYAERFSQRARLLVDESQASLCRHYLAGLNSDMRALCRLDRDNREWTSLQALIEFSFGEELRWHPTRALMSRSQSQPASRTQHQNTPPAPVSKQWEYKKRPRANEVLAAAATAPAAKAPKVKDERPMEECRFYKHQGTLTQEIKDELKKFGICWYCRSGRHFAKACPAKK